MREADRMPGALRRACFLAVSEKIDKDKAERYNQIYINFKLPRCAARGKDLYEL